MGETREYTPMGIYVDAFPQKVEQTLKTFVEDKRACIVERYQVTEYAFRVVLKISPEGVFTTCVLSPQRQDLEME